MLSQVYRGLGETEQQTNSLKDAIRCSSIYVQMARVSDPDSLVLAELAVNEYPEIGDTWIWLAGLHMEGSPEKAARYYWQSLLRKPSDLKTWQALGRSLAALDTNTALQLYHEMNLDQLAESDGLWKFEARFIFASILSNEQPDLAIQLYRQTLQFRQNDGVRWRELGDLLRERDPQAAIQAYLQSCYNLDPGLNGCYRAGRTAEKLGDLQAAVRYYRLSKSSSALGRADKLEEQIRNALP